MDLRLRSIRCERTWNTRRQQLTILSLKAVQTGYCFKVIYGRPKVYRQISSMCLLEDFQPISRRSQPTRNHANNEEAFKLNASAKVVFLFQTQTRQGIMTIGV